MEKPRPEVEASFELEPAPDRDARPFEVPVVVEVRMEYTKDVVSLAKGSGCSWK